MLPRATVVSGNPVVIVLRGVLLLSLAVLHVQAAPADAQTPTTTPRVALVLSGGGARGFAHVGVLRALQRLQVPVDIVVGASMGAVVGGAFCRRPRGR